MLLEHEGDYGLRMDVKGTVCPWSIWFGHGCNGNRMLLEQEGEYGLGMDAMVAVCSWSTKEIMVWAWMHWLPYALGTLGHGCSPNRSH